MGIRFSHSRGLAPTHKHPLTHCLADDWLEFRDSPVLANYCHADIILLRPPFDIPRKPGLEATQGPGLRIKCI